MQNTTGCKINVSPAAGQDFEREIGLVGSRDSIERAKNAIMEKVHAVVSPLLILLTFLNPIHISDPFSTAREEQRPWPTLRSPKPLQQRLTVLPTSAAISAAVW